jgi:hypothetical protein
VSKYFNSGPCKATRETRQTSNAMKNVRGMPKQATP